MSFWIQIQDRPSVGPALCPNCLQRSLADDNFKLSLARKESMYMYTHNLIFIINCMQERSHL